MFWTLLLSHLMADYPLQTDAMVQAKKHLPGLLFHVTVHLVTMLVILLGLVRLEWRTALFAVVAVTGLHFAIDVWKNVLAKRKPQWVIGGYLQDQLLHLASLWLVATWFAPGAAFALPASWVIYASGYILVTHAWFVTERVLTYRNKARQTLVSLQLWPRMVSRALLLTLLLLGWHQWGPAGLASAALFSWPYGRSVERQRLLLIDLAVAVAVLLFILMAGSH
ncbi:MAG: DUF3307 domain-containing protein [Caldilineaceae bacterium]|nr:DUF3307 domain-containing protein [Caldilineaceae bacterium]